MKYAIVFDKVLKAYKTCLLDDAEGCDILVQFDANGPDEALQISEDYLRDKKVSEDEIKCKEGLQIYKNASAAYYKSRLNAADLTKDQAEKNMNRQYINPPGADRPDDPFTRTK